MSSRAFWANRSAIREVIAAECARLREEDGEGEEEGDVRRERRHVCSAQRAGGTELNCRHVCVLGAGGGKGGREMFIGRLCGWSATGRLLWVIGSLQAAVGGWCWRGAGA